MKSNDENQVGLENEPFHAIREWFGRYEDKINPVTQLEGSLRGKKETFSRHLRVV